jgi:capsular polysaccharide transport system permease protein
MKQLPIRRGLEWAYEWCSRHRLFVFITLLPTLLSLIYFSFVASDVYISDSSFIVRSPQEQAGSDALGGLLRSVGFARAQDDAYTVAEYLQSRDAVRALDADPALHLGRAFSSPGVDRISRFGGLTFDTSFEALYLYSQNKITATLDQSSSIIELETKAFSADDAWRIDEVLLDQADVLVNQLNEQARQDMIRFDLQAVERDQKAVMQAELALSEYRNRRHVLEPEKEAVPSFDLISKLQGELIQALIDEFKLELVAHENPAVEVAKQRVTLLRKAIEDERGRIAGGGAESLAGKTVEYQRLLIEREAADKMLASALAGLEQARNQELKKQLYLERIAEPSKPDYPLEPHRVRNIVVTLVLSLMIWGIIALLAAGVREHAS